MKHSIKKANITNSDPYDILLPQENSLQEADDASINTPKKKIIKKIVKKVLHSENNLEKKELLEPQITVLEPDNQQEIYQPNYDSNSNNNNNNSDEHFWITNLVENSSNLMCVVKDGLISYINKTGVSMLKFLDPLEIITMPFIDIFDDGAKEKFNADFDNIINNQNPYQSVFITTENQKLDVELSIISLPNGDENSFLVEAKNISYIKKIEEKYRANEQKVKQNFMHDDLTGLPSSNLFEDRLQMAIARSARRAYGKADAAQNRIAVIVMNVDKIDAISQELGVDAANHVLRNIAIRLASSFRNCDTIAKNDSKSFLLILEGLNSLDDAETVARRTLGIMYEQIGYKGSNLALGCSIGISIFPEHGIKARKLLNAAEKALDEVSKNGGNFYMIYNESLDEA